MSDKTITTPTQRTWLGQQWAAAIKNNSTPGLYLQQCQQCQTVQYPPREICRHCLGAQLTWSAVENTGSVLACNALHHSHDAFFQQHLPWLMGSVKLSCGPVAFAHVADDVQLAGSEVRLISVIDCSDQVVLLAIDKSQSIADHTAINQILHSFHLLN